MSAPSNSSAAAANASPASAPSAAPLSIRQRDLDALRLHGEETYPHECCGVLLGAFAERANEVSEVVRAGNTRTDSAHNRYSIAPQELVRIQRQARAKGLDIVGFYHSHPDHPAMWSPTDFAEAHWIGCSYVITSVLKGAASQTSAFLLTGADEEDKAFADQPLQVGPREAAGPEGSRHEAVAADTLLACRP